MKGDFSKTRFDKTKHYSSVRMQQGRVQLDADWNEQVDIVNRRIQMETQDFIGGHGTPTADEGFSISVVDGQNLQIGAGRYYVEGILCENEANVFFTEQPDYPGASLPAVDGFYLAYLDVWQHGITAIDDPTLLESALGGVDTTTRIKNIGQVKLMPLDTTDIAAPDCNNIFAADTPAGETDQQTWDDLTASASGQLTAQVSDSATLDNRLYRVEIHQGGDKSTATFKWSRDNAAIAVGIDTISYSSHRINIHPAGMMQAQLATGQWLELNSTARELRNEAGFFVKLAHVDNTLLDIAIWDPAILQESDPQAYLDGLQLTIARRWDTEQVAVSHTQFNDFVTILEPIVDLGDELTIQLHADDLPDRLSAGEFLALSRQALIDNNEDGYFVWLQTITDNGDNTVTLTADKINADPAESLANLDKLRRVNTVDEAIEQRDFIALEQGLEINFSEGNYKSADYWLIPARAATHNIEWPPASAQAPHGVAHYYTYLAIVELNNGVWQVFNDCRLVFEPIASFKSLTAFSAENSAPIAAVHVDDVGQVGIATTDPQATLEVVGSSRVSSSTLSSAQIGHYEPDDSGYAYQQVDVLDGIAYIAAASSGLHIVDVSNPALPYALAMTAEGGGEAYDVRVIEDTDTRYAYLAAGTKGLQIFEVSDPTAPLFRAYSVYGQDPPDARAIRVLNNNAYLADANTGLHILDVTNHSPAASDFIHIDGIIAANDLVVIGDYAYVAGENASNEQGLHIVHLMTQTVVGKLIVANTALSIAIEGDVAYVGVANSGGLVSIDITDPMAPVELHRIAFMADVKQIVTWQDKAYLAIDTLGLQIIDISEPTQLKLLHSAEIKNNALGITFVDNKVYVTHAEPGLHILDVYTANTHLQVEANALTIETQAIDALRPHQIPMLTQVASYATPARAQQLSVLDHYVYIIECAANGEPASLQIIDIGDASNPNFVSSDTTSLSDPRAIHVAGHYAYIADAEGLKVIDISDPNTPVLAAQSENPFLASDIHVLDNFAYLTEDFDPSSKLRIFNISGLLTALPDQFPLTLSEATSTDIGERGFAVQATHYGSHTYICVVSDADLRVIKIQGFDAGGNPLLEAPQISVELPDYALSVQVSSHYAYVANGQYGMRVFDLIPSFDEASPPLLVDDYAGLYRHNINHITDVNVAGRYAYLTDDSLGIKVLDISEPNNPQLIDRHSSLSTATALSLQGDYVYVVDSQTGLQIISLTPQTKISDQDSSYIGSKLGIGHSEPETTLDVNGDTTCRGDLTVTGAFNYVPAGAVFAYAAEFVPAGFYECNGHYIKQSEAPNLYDVIGDMYGPPDSDADTGEETFKLPDYRGYFLRGWDNNAGVDPDVASRTDRGDGTGRDVVGSKQGDEFKRHDHNYTYYGWLAPYGGNNRVAWESTSTRQTSTTGGNETRPKNINVMYIIKR